MRRDGVGWWISRASKNISDRGSLDAGGTQILQIHEPFGLRQRRLDRSALPHGDEILGLTERHRVALSPLEAIETYRRAHQFLDGIVGLAEPLGASSLRMEIEIVSTGSERPSVLPLSWAKCWICGFTIRL